MPEVAEAAVSAPVKSRARDRGLAAVVRKRWRAWLRAVHRDIGYFAVGFTVIYAMSGIAMNHIDDWDPNFHTSELTKKIAPIDDGLGDADAARRIAEAAGVTGKPEDVYRAGDEVRLSFPGGAKVTAIGDTLTVQNRSDRMFFRVADWLHATRGKQVWKYISDAYAVLLLYLALSGLFMIKGRLGLRWRGAALAAVGLAVPLGYIVLSGGPGAQKTERVAAKPGEVDPAGPASPAGKPSADGITRLPADDQDLPAKRPPARTPSADGAAPLPADGQDSPAKRPPTASRTPSADGITPLPPDDEEAPVRR